MDFSKNAHRVHQKFDPGTPEWDEAYEMLLPDGMTCKKCRHFKMCSEEYDQPPDDTSCSHYTNLFSQHLP